MIWIYDDEIMTSDTLTPSMFVNAPACLLLLLAVVAVFLSQTCLAIYRYRSLYNEDGQLTLLQFLTLLSKHCIRLT